MPSIVPMMGYPQRRSSGAIPKSSRVSKNPGAVQTLSLLGATMFAGHIGIALAAARVEPRINVGIFAAAALLLDFLLWLFILFGFESVAIPVDFPRTHQPEFVFPYSHSLLASLLWSILAAVLAFLLLGSRVGEKKLRSALLIAAVVFSHWLLDALVHRPELPITLAASHQVGLGLWNNMPVALVVEAVLVLVGAILFFPGCDLSRRKRLALFALSLLVFVFTALGMTVAPSPPSTTAMAGSSLATIFMVCLFIGFLGHGAGIKKG